MRDNNYMKEQNHHYTRAEQFLSAFNEIEESLRRYYQPRKRAGFMQMLNTLKRINPIIAIYAEDLEQFASLRNCIVHTRRGNLVIAEPHPATLQRILQIRDSLQQPQNITQFMVQNPYTAQLNTPLIQIITTFEKRNFLRCPILENQQVQTVITAKAITQWLAHKSLQHSPLTLADTLQQTPAKQLLPFTSPKDYQFLHPQASIHDAITLFQKNVQQGKNLLAILITPQANKNGPVQGILTPSDLPRFFPNTTY